MQTSAVYNCLYTRLQSLGIKGIKKIVIFAFSSFLSFVFFFMYYFVTRCHYYSFRYRI